MKKQLRIFLCFLIFTLSANVFAKPAHELDYSACNDIYQFLEKLKKGETKENLITELNQILKTKPYEHMFIHYNRKRRPNHLPEDVFKRMILSLRFENVYQKGENKRADMMFPYWKKFYDDLSLFKENIDAMKTLNIDTMIHDAVKYANTFLPESLKLSSSYIFILPQGGSNAFVVPIEKIKQPAQGIDFFQLKRDKNGRIDWKALSTILAHESHHLGFDPPLKEYKDEKKTMLYRVSLNYLGEGAANKLIQNLPGGCVPKVRPKDNLYTDILTGTAKDDWDTHDQEKREIFNRFISDLRYLMKNGVDDKWGKEWDAYWYSPMTNPRFYFLGSELIGVVYHGFGNKGVLKVLSDPITLYAKYNEAVKKRPDILGACPLIPDDIMAFSR